MITLILAVDENNLIGNSQAKYGLAWQNKEDLQHFKNTTLKHKVVYGSTTYQKMGKLLSDRENYIVSRSLKDIKGATVIHDFTTFLQQYQFNDEEVFICGGKSIYLQSVPYASKILLSRISGKHQGDVYIEPFWEQLELKQVKDYETFTLEIYER